MSQIKSKVNREKREREKAEDFETPRRRGVKVENRRR